MGLLLADGYPRELTEPIEPYVPFDAGEALLPFEAPDLIGLQDNDDPLPPEAQPGRQEVVPGWVRTPSEANAWAKHQHDINAYWWHFLCLKFVHESLNVPSKWPTAGSAWHNTPIGDRHYGKPPPGVSEFFNIPNSVYDHVVLVSMDTDYCWSNDIVERGHISRVSRGAFGRSWNATRYGWTESLNGVQIYNDGTFFLDASVIQVRTRLHEKYRHGMRLKHWVAAETRNTKGFKPMNLNTPILGPAFRADAALVQHKAGVAGPYDGLLGVTSLTWLANRHSDKAVVVA